ncbi:MAG TPA: hypothetical protein VI504_09800, partial [Candidatus Eisenbacteria bacterium]
MRIVAGLVVTLAFPLGALLAPASARAAGIESRLAALAGYWRGQVECAGSRSWLAIEFVPADSGRMTARMTLPAIRGYDFPIGPARLARDSVFAGPFVFAWDERADRLTGVLPRALVPVHEIPVDLRRGAP